MSENSNALIVDDSQAIRHYMHAILSTEQWFDKIVTVESTDEAINLLDSDDHNIGWVFSDWEINGTPSQALLDHIRERYPRDEMRFVMLTELQEKQLALQSLPVEVNEYLCKPFEPNTLLNILRRYRGLPERRVAERVKPDFPYELSIVVNEAEREAELLNISGSGCLLSTSKFSNGECSIYDVIGLQLTIFDEELDCIDAEVVRMERCKTGSIADKKVQVALNFLDLPGEIKERLEVHIETCR